MISEIKGKGYSASLQYIQRTILKTSVEVTEDSADDSASGSLPQSGTFFWKQIFNKIDVSGDGIISKDEFETAVTKSSAIQSLLSLFQDLDSADTVRETAEKQSTDPSAAQMSISQTDHVFSIIDADKDGSVGLAELADAKAQILKRMQNSMARLQFELTEAFLNMLETSGSLGCRGGVLVNQGSPSMAQTGSGEAEGIFKKIDANLDGKISRDELVKALSETREKLDNRIIEDQPDSTVSSLDPAPGTAFDRPSLLTSGPPIKYTE